MNRRILRRAASAVLAVVLVGGLAACSNDPLADQYREGSNKGFIAGDSRVLETPAEERGEPIAFDGVNETGEAVSSADFAGRVLVVNFWYAACGPCRAEAGELAESAASFADQDVSFLGVNIYDQPATTVSFMETYGVDYPSLIAVDDADLTLAFADAVPLTAVPVTLVLDAQGRVASRIIGQIPDPSILNTLVRDTLAETS
ncbi:TlpA family protein disulfide reductase [Microbacterium sp. GXF7504]